MSPAELSSSQINAIVILCHRRTRHLEEVIEALQMCEEVEDYFTVFVVQDPIKSVIDIINKYPLKKIVLNIDGSNYASGAQAINGNLFAGLEFCFSKIRASFAIVLEDDIVLAPDALVYFRSAIRFHRANSAFRGVNAFSETIASPALRDAYVRTNYGFGWGWAIHLESYLRIRRFWKGTEDNHWDFILEPYLRTGFVINPIRSRIINIGFDVSATHTSGNQELGTKILESFNSSLLEPRQRDWEAKSDFIWMGNSLNYSNLNTLQMVGRKLIYISFVLFGDSRLHHKIRRLLNRKF